MTKQFLRPSIRQKSRYWLPNPIEILEDRIAPAARLGVDAAAIVSTQNDFVANRIGFNQFGDVASATPNSEVVTLRSAVSSRAWDGRSYQVMEDSSHPTGSDWETGVVAETPSPLGNFISPPRSSMIAATADATTIVAAKLADRLGLTLPSSPSMVLAQDSASTAIPFNVVPVGWHGESAIPQSANSTSPAAEGAASPRSTVTSAGPTANLSLSAQGVYSNGFEAAEGFSPGFIGTQGGWSHISSNTLQPVISSAHASTGTQHFRIAKHAGLAVGANVGAISPNLGALPAGRFVVSMDVAISDDNGAAYYVTPQSPSQSFKTAEVAFWYEGSIYVLDDTGSGLALVDTGTDWTIGAYKTLMIDVDADANTIKYYYDGTLIYTGVVWGGTSVEQVVLRGDNYNFADVGDFDNVQIQSFADTPADLTLTKDDNWNDVLPIDVVQRAGRDNHSYDGPYFSDQTLYFNWESANFGTGPESLYTVRVEVTGAGGDTFEWTGVSTPSGSAVHLLDDQPVGPLAPGTHVFRIWVDHSDTVDEADEFDNYYERTITVLPAGAPEARDILPEPLGVSPGMSWFQSSEQIFDFGGEHVYAVDLVAGQRLSASVQTPEAGGAEYFSTSVVPVPDTGATVSSTITIANGETIEDLDVGVMIEHRNVGDLDVVLVSPTGTRIDLSTRNGGSGNHYENTIFDDEASTIISAATAPAPFFGRYRPESPLSALDGADSAGVWRLEVTDRVSGNSENAFLFSWSLRVNQGLDASLTISGPDGVLASNLNAFPGIRDAAIVDVTVPTTGRYLFTVGNQDLNVGSYVLEAGIYAASVPVETGDVTNLDPMRAANGNVALLGRGDGVGQQDIYTITLNAGEAVNIAGTTPGGFYSPYVTVTGPNGFNAGAPIPGPNFDSAQLFTAPATGTYVIAVAYTFDDDYTDTLSTGTYALTVALSDTANNDSRANARPISSFDYLTPTTVTSWYYDVVGELGIWRGEIDTAELADYFSLGTLAAGQLIGVTALSEGTSQILPLIALVDGSGEIVTVGLPFQDPALGGISFFETIINQAGEYYAIVLGDVSVPGGDVGSTGAYVLAFADFGVLEDDYEQNDTKAQVDAAPAGAVNSPNLGVVGQVTAIDDLAMMEDSEDLFRFQTTVTGSRGDYVRIEFADAQGNLNLDLLDADGRLVRRSQRSTDNERVSLQGLPAGTYYARIWGQNDAKNPHYNLRIQSGAPDGRLLSAPYTTDAQYAFSYEIGGSPGASSVALENGDNELIVTTASSGALPFQMIFDVTRVGSMADQEQQQYDALGHLSRKTDAMGRDTVYEFDALGRVSFVDGPQLGDASAFFHDANGNLTRIIDASVGTTEYEYDELDRLKTIVMPNGLGTVQYTYTASGQVSSITYPGGSIVSYLYDFAGRLKQVTDGADVTTYVYNAAGQLASMTQPNGVTATYGYDSFGRLIDLRYETAGGLLVTAFHYALDANGNRTAMDVSRPNGDTPDPSDFFTAHYLYAYDSLNRLSQATYPDSSVVTYAYDANNNRSSVTTDPDGAGPLPASVEFYHVGYDNRLESITDAAGATLKRFFYDPRGNVVMQVTPTETTRYEFDYRNLMTAVETGTTRVEYFYDGNGDRVAQTINGVRTNFVNDPNRDYTQVLAEVDAAGLQQSRFVYGGNRISEQLSGQGSSVYVVADAIGSTSDLTSGSATVLQSYSYDAFGAPRSIDLGGMTGLSGNPFTFAGESFQADIAIGYFRARYYDPATGRFESKDPSGFVDGPNMYGYVNANPVNLTDPSGRIAWIPVAAAALQPGVQGALRSVAAYLITSTNYSWRGVAGAAFGGFVSAYSPTPWVRGMVSAYSSYVTSNDPTGIRIANAAISGILTSFGATGLRASIARGVLTNYFTKPIVSAFGSLSRGGVLLNKAADFVGDLKQITGATVDPVTGQVVLLGNESAGGIVAGLRMDDFVTAVRSIFGSAEDPGVTIDPQPGHEDNQNVPQLVHLFGGLEDTDMGYVVFEADRVMKSINSRRDNITYGTVGSSVPGYKSLLDRWFEREVATNGRSRSESSRFWWVPNDVKLVRSDDGQSFVFDRAAVKLMTEASAFGNGAVDPDAQALADWYNANFAAIAAEAYPYPSRPGYEHSFQRLEQVARAVAFARFLRDNDIPVDFSWMQNYQVPVVPTPETTRTVYNSRTGQSSSGWITITTIITGGVTMDVPNTYVSGTSGVQGTVLGSRPSDIAQQWTTTVNGQQQTAVALSLDTGFVDGVQRRSDVDLSYQTPGDVPFGLTRYYVSSTPTEGPMGFGWEFVPASMDFTMPEFYTSYYAKTPSPWIFLNGLHSGEIRINDLATGRVYTFESSFDFRYGPAVNFGLDSNDVPVFIPGGSEQPDGSTLVQTPGTLTYVFTRPDGTRLVFDYRGNLLQQIDNRNRAITYGYTSGNVTSISDAAGQMITLTYVSGRVTQAVGLGGEVVNYTYSSSLGNLEAADRVRGGIHSIWTYSYDATASPDDDHLINEATPPDRVLESKTFSDILGRATASEDARGNRFEQTFDSATRTTTSHDVKDGSTTRLQTDSLGRTIVSIDELGRKTQYHYDVIRVFGPQYPGGWTYVGIHGGTNRQPSLILEPDPGRPWIFREFDDVGNLIREEDVSRGGDDNGDDIDDHPHLWEYDGANNVTRFTDARGLVTTYAYETLFPGTPQEQLTNRRTSMTRGFGTPRAATWTWEYYPDTGKLHREIDPSGVMTEYTYDAIGNVLTKTVAPGTPDQVVTTYGYDAFSNRTSQTDSLGRRTEWIYNGRGQIITTRLVGAFALEAHSTYDGTTGRKLTDTDYRGNVTSHVYDNATGDMTSQISATGTPEEAVTQIRYDRFGNAIGIVDPIGNVTSFDFDRLQRQTGKTSLGSTTRVVASTGTNSDVTIEFSAAIDVALVNNGVDIVVVDSNDQAISGSLAWSADGTRLTWSATAAPLLEDTYSITLRATASGQFTDIDGRLLDGDSFGMLPSGDNVAGGDFVMSWFVDDHGNDAPHATAVTVPSSTAGELEFVGDQDWYRLDVSAGMRLRLEVVLGSQAGSLFDSELTLYDQDGVTVLQKNDDVDGAVGQYGSRIDFEIPRSGVYFLRVTSASANNTGYYALNANVLADDHPDDAPGTSAVAPSVTEGNLEVATDRDTFSFNAVAGGSYRITTILGTLADSTLTLLAADGTTVLASNDDFYGGNPAAFVYWTAPASGTYHIQVASPGGQHQGTYKLAVSNDDFGDYVGVATTIAAPSQTNGQLEVTFDNDWFSFTATANHWYRLDALSNGLPNPFLAIFDSSQALASNDDYQGADATIFWQAPADGVFHLKVSGHDGSGEYLLRVNELVDDHGNDAAHATLLAAPDSMPGNLERPTDSDWFAFDVMEGTRYRIETILNGLADSVLRLHATDGTTILDTNDDFQGLGSRLEFLATSTERLYASVRSFGDAYDGAYDFHVQPLEDVLPIVTQISPFVGPTTGFTVTITGANFLNATTVTFGATAVAIPANTSDTEIVVTAPSSASVGNVVVTVTTPIGTSTPTAFTPGIDQITYLPTKMTSVVINNGGIQRSSVRSITLNFDAAVQSAPASAFSITDQADNPIAGLIVGVAGVGTSSLTLTFSDANSDALGPVTYGSLVDGRYKVTVDGSLMTSLNAAVDADGDGQAGGVSTTLFSRLFGDVNADGFMDALDIYPHLINAIDTLEGNPGYNVAFDYDNDGDVDAVDIYPNIITRIDTGI